jgi:RsiW-degrading membrane proteinase PrsW (M82 family)
MHWLYALAAAAIFLAAMLLLFEHGSATLAQVLTIGICTATFGILFLLCVQWIAEVTQGYIVYGRSILVLLFYVVKFIGFSYRAALDPDMGFWASFFGYIFGVGLCEELTKALPVIVRIRGGGLIDWRGACIWGLASGIGFGVAEGILYSSSHYNGVSTGGVYLVRFISCAGLHAVWGASAGIMVWRRKEWLASDWDWGDMAATLLWALAIPMVLHGLYDTLLKKGMNALALVAALASFAWLAFLIEWTRSQEVAFFAAQSRKLRARPYGA